MSESSNPQAEQEQMIALTKRMLKSSQFAAVLAWACSIVEGRDRNFIRSKKDITKRLEEIYAAPIAQNPDVPDFAPSYRKP